MSDDGAKEVGLSKEVHSSSKIEVASKVIANPDHPRHSEDRVVAMGLVNGKSGLIAAIDGVGGGGEDSAQASQICYDRLATLQSRFLEVPSIVQAKAALSHELVEAAQEVRALQTATGNESADTTVSAILLCRAPNGIQGWDSRDMLGVVPHVGDSSIIRYRPSTGEVSSFTKDDTLVQSLVDVDMLSEKDAFNHPQRNIITSALGDINSKEDVNFFHVQVKPGDILVASTDGFTDNFTPPSLPRKIQGSLEQAAGPGKVADMKKFAINLAEGAHNVMRNPNVPHGKKDDVGVVVMKVPRKTHPSSRN